MNHTPEYYASRPNLLRVATEISKMNHPERVEDALTQPLAAHAETESPAPLPVPERRTNKERFNAVLNRCENPRAVFNALMAFAEAGKGDAE